MDFEENGLRFQVEVGSDDDLPSEESELDYVDDLNDNESDPEGTSDSSQPSENECPSKRSIQAATGDNPTPGIVK